MGRLRHPPESSDPLTAKDMEADGHGPRAADLRAVHAGLEPAMGHPARQRQARMGPAVPRNGSPRGDLGHAPPGGLSLRDRQTQPPTAPGREGLAEDPALGVHGGGTAPTD